MVEVKTSKTAQLNVRVDAALLTRAKLTAVRRGTTLQDLVDAALRAYLKGANKWPRK
jgi:predicted DNA binding CopG/RHH family protein